MIGQAVKTDAFLFPIRPAIRWAGSSGTFRANERDWIAPNPPAGAWINVYLKAAPKSPVTITISDKAGKTVRTLRQRGEAGVNRFVWNLRHDLPGGPGGGPAEAAAELARHALGTPPLAGAAARPRGRPSCPESTR